MQVIRKKTAYNLYIFNTSKVKTAHFLIHFLQIRRYFKQARKEAYFELNCSTLRVG